MKCAKVKEMAAKKKIHVVPSFQIETLKEMADNKYEFFDLFWTNNKLEEAELKLQWLNFTLMRNHFDVLHKLYKSSQDSEERLIKFIHQGNKEQMEVNFNQSIEHQKALNEKFKITNENVNNFANSVIDISIDQSKETSNQLENEEHRLEKKIKRDTGFVEESKTIISGIDTSMKNLKGTMTAQVEKLKDDLKGHLFIEAAKAVIAACVAVVGAFWGNPPDTSAFEAVAGMFLLKFDENIQYLCHLSYPKIFWFKTKQ